MKEIIFESEIFAEDSNGSVFPFKIVIESEIVNNIKMVTVYRNEIISIPNGSITEKTTMLNSTFWRVNE